MSCVTTQTTASTRCSLNDLATVRVGPIFVALDAPSNRFERHDLVSPSQRQLRFKATPPILDPFIEPEAAADPLVLPEPRAEGPAPRLADQVRSISWCIL